MVLIWREARNIGALDRRRHRGPRRQGDGEGRTLAGPARSLDVPAQELAKMLRDGQTKTRTAILLRAGGMDLAECLKQPAELSFGDADAGIGNGEPDHRAVGFDAFRR